MNNISFGTQILLLVIVLHFVVGFGYLMYKLSPRKKDHDNSDTKDQE